jgi:hypothetical protein
MNIFRKKETHNQIESISNDCQEISYSSLKTSYCISPTQSTGTGTYCTDNYRHYYYLLEPTLIITYTKYKTTNE